MLGSILAFDSWNVEALNCPLRSLHTLHMNLIPEVFFNVEVLFIGEWR